MADGNALTPAEALFLLAQESGDSYQLLGRLAGGETGAHKVQGPDGQPLVVKWELSPDQRALRSEAVLLSERLRTEAQWPVPRQWTLDTAKCLFVIQEFLPGEPVKVVSHRIVDRIFELHESRIGLAKATDATHWPSALITTLVDGGESYCRHESLREYDHRTADLVSRIEHFGSTIRETDLPGTDVVHWDLHLGNMLEDESGLSAIVDTDFAVVGDAAFDLVALAMTSVVYPSEPGVRERLSAAAFENLGDIPRLAYLAHLVLRVVDWPIRRGSHEEVEIWLKYSDEVLDF